MELKPKPDIEAIFKASILPSLGYSAHARATHGSMVVYTSLEREAAVKIYVKDGETRCDVYTILPQSMLRVSIESCSFPHANMVNLLNQIEKVSFAWKKQEGIL